VINRKHREKLDQEHRARAIQEFFQPASRDNRNRLPKETVISNIGTAGKGGKLEDDHTNGTRHRYQRAIVDKGKRAALLAPQFSKKYYAKHHINIRAQTICLATNRRRQEDLHQPKIIYTGDNHRQVNRYKLIPYGHTGLETLLVELVPKH
jgi:hypothetical protein